MLVRNVWCWPNCSVVLVFVLFCGLAHGEPNSLAPLSAPTPAPISARPTALMEEIHEVVSLAGLFQKAQKALMVGESLSGPDIVGSWEGAEARTTFALAVGQGAAYMEAGLLEWQYLRLFNSRVRALDKEVNSLRELASPILVPPSPSLDIQRVELIRRRLPAISEKLADIFDRLRGQLEQ